MNKIIAKVGQAGLMTMLGYEIGQGLSEPVIVKVNSDDIIKKNEEPVDSNKDLLVFVIFLLVVLIILLAVALIFRKKNRQRNALHV